VLERTPEGLEIHHSRYGPYIRHSDGRCEMLPTPIKLRRPERRQEPAGWSPWDH
jgi:hypothetical protein